VGGQEARGHAQGNRDGGRLSPPALMAIPLGVGALVSLEMAGANDANARPDRHGHVLSHASPGQRHYELLIRAIVSVRKQHQHHRGPQPALPQQYHRFAHRTERAEQATGRPRAHGPHKPEAERGIGPHYLLDVTS
jgi:hypothetical protein